MDRSIARSGIQQYPLRATIYRIEISVKITYLNQGVDCAELSMKCHYIAQN